MSECGLNSQIILTSVFGTACSAGLYVGTSSETASWINCHFCLCALQSGALLACGIVNSGVRNECDPALALLSDYVLHNSNVMRIGAIFG